MLASLLTVWVTFVPCFLFIFLGAPYVERLRHNRQLTAALNGITAAVVGVIASLALYFALHTLFTTTVPVAAGPLAFEIPVLTSLDLLSVIITAVAARPDLLAALELRCAPSAPVRRSVRSRHRPAARLSPGEEARGSRYFKTVPDPGTVRLG